MAKTLANYDPLVQIPSGMTPAGADFPIVESHDILVGENDKRLDAKLDDIDSAIGNVGQTPIATQLSSKVNTGDIVTSVAATGSTSNNKIPSETAVRAAIEAKTINVDTTVTQGSTNAVSGGAVHTQLATKQDTLTFDTTPTASSSNPVTSGGVKTALDAKQDALTFDTTPTASSSNPVTSGGVKAALDNKQNTLTYETTPIAGSVNPVTSTGIRNAIDAAAAGNLGDMQAQYAEFVADADAILDRASSLSNGMVACSNIAAETTVGDTRILLYTGTTNSTYTNGHWYYNSAASDATPVWTDGGAVGSAPTIDNTLTTAGAAADSKSVGDAIENIVTISNTQPGANSGNKVWIKETTDEEVQIPTYEEHISKANKADITTNNESDNGSGTITASKAYAIGDHFYINNTNTSSENYGVSTLYKATAAITSGSAIVVGTNCEAARIANELISLSNDIDTVKADLGDVSGTTENIFDMSVFDGVEGITKDANGYYTGTGQAFANAFLSGVPELTFSANTQYYLSVIAYTDGNVSISAVNGLQFTFYTGDNTRIGRKSVLNSVTTPEKTELFSTAGNSIGYMTIGVSSSALNIWHVKNIMLIASSVGQEYVPHVTANDIKAREMASQSIYASDLAGAKVSGGYISLQFKFVGDTVDLTPVANTSMSYVLLDCGEGDCFVITSTGLSAAKAYAFIDSNNVITEVCDTSDQILTDYAVIAPSSGKLIINSVNSKPFAFRKVVNAVEVERVNDAQFLREINKSYRWKGKKIATFGDSRTWYDGHLYTENTKSEWTGKVCVGYQQQIRNILMAEVLNQGASGYTSVQICDLIRNFDFAGYDAVFLEGGVNDFVKSSQITIGEIASIGSAFDTSTVYGAWQSAIEYILTNYPSVLIYMDIPAIAWIHQADDIFPYDIAKIKGEIANLYNIPCLDLYKTGGINVINRDYWYCDDVTSTNWRLHFNDFGNALVGAKIAEFMLAN